MKYASLSDNTATSAVEAECVARTYYRLGDFMNAKKYAVESLEIYKTLGADPVITGSIDRVNELLVLLEQGQR